ncbi:MAG: bifunctional diguanylate cyclase/phosphodiesterase [Mycobacterium sp.]|nr:bifunctional diguanylate cyclase/phosphodiesterase [Mycobacterium sp.]
MLKRLTLVPLLLSAAAFVLFAAWLTAGWGGPRTVQVVSDVGSLFFGVVAAFCAALAARTSHRRQRRAWYALMIGLICWVLGDAIWAYYELVRGMQVAPYPSLADVAYLLFPVAAGIALVLFPVGYIGQSQLRAVLDGVIVAGSLFAIVWTSGLYEVFNAGAESAFAFLVSIAYPLTDLVMLTTAVLVLSRAQVGQRLSFTLFAAGVAAIAVADSVFVYLSIDDDYATGNPIDIGYAAGLLLLAAAALVDWQSPQQERVAASIPSWMTLWLPYVPLPVAIGVGMAYAAREPHDLVVLFTLAGLIATVLVRQFLVLAENRRLLVEVANQALRDPLTGLANRDLFHDRLTHAIALQMRDDREVAVLSLDLDDFKLVNDSLGHSAGDALLKSVAERILGCVRSADTAARLGGDEFAILLEDGPDSPMMVANRICEAFETPFLIDGHSWSMRASVGVAIGPPPTGPAELAAESLLKNADLAMYSAKRDQVGMQQFSADMRLIDRTEVDPGRLRAMASAGARSPGRQLFTQLRQAIEQGDLTLVYQPKFELSTGHIAGVEALVRWPHPIRGVLAPDAFLPLARENGLMGALTEMVLTRAADDAAAWRAQGQDVSFAVNLFPLSLTDPKLAPQIVRILKDRAVPAESLTVEITEEIRLGNLDDTRSELQRLRESGVRISLDDFGCGYSGLSYLGELRVDELKLDRQFVSPILDREPARVIVRSVIEMAHALEITCVAEGVEDAATAQLLAQYGCDMIQGNYCSPPVPAAQVPTLSPVAGHDGALR